MTVSRFCAGFALLAAAACTQEQRINVPSTPAATGYVPPSYVSTDYAATAPVQVSAPRYVSSGAVPNYAPPLAGAQNAPPLADVTTVAAPPPPPPPPLLQPETAVQSFAASPAILQSVPTYDAEPPRYLPQEPQVITNATRVYAPAPNLASGPAPARPPAYTQATYTPAPDTQATYTAAAIQPIRESARAPLASYGKDTPPPRTNRRFTTIDDTRVAELSTQGERTPALPQTIARVSGQQVTTAEPFSIPTSPTGKPYYLSATPPAIEYHIPHIPQEEPLWCWAAAAQQAIGWVNKGRAPSQCAIVALAHGLNVQECCSDREGICARTGEIPAIATLVESFGGEARELATVPRDPQTIYDILRKGDTLLIRLRPAPHDEAVGIRHMIVVRGIEWLRLPNNQLQATLLYNDPLGAGERAVNFDEIEGFFEQALVVSRI